MLPESCCRTAKTAGECFLQSIATTGIVQWSFCNDVNEMKPISELKQMSNIDTFFFDDGRIRATFAVALLLLVAGCSTAPSADYSKLDLVNVTGTINLDGTPLVGAVITFEDPETSQFSYGQSDASGNYYLRLDTNQDGVVPGKKVVRISTTRKILGLNDSEEEEDGEVEADGKGAEVPTKAMELVPEKYNKKSELEADVSASATEFNFDLSSK